MSKQLTIILEGKPYTIDALTIGQCRDCAIGVVSAQTDTPQQVVESSYNRGIAILAAALSRNYKELGKTTAERMATIENMTITRAELTAATDAILEFSGLIPPKTAEGNGSGKAQAEAA
jgi:hypothetical protein